MPVLGVSSVFCLACLTEPRWAKEREGAKEGERPLNNVLSISFFQNSMSSVLLDQRDSCLIQTPKGTAGEGRTMCLCVGTEAWTHSCSHLTVKNAFTHSCLFAAARLRTCILSSHYCFQCINWRTDVIHLTEILFLNDFMWQIINWLTWKVRACVLNIESAVLAHLLQVLYT